VKLAKLVPWDFVEEVYLRSLGRKKEGQRALPGRFAFGSILIQEKLGLTDRETVDTIRENPYLQWFLGLQEFQIKPPLDQSQLCRFRKRFPAQAIAEINERILLAARKRHRDDESSSSDDGGFVNKGRLIVDATATPADITFPTDLKLLNKGRELLEKMVDVLHSEREPGSTKPRTYRKRARKAFLSLQKTRRPGSRKLRKAMRKQLGYVRRDLGHVDALLDEVGFGVLDLDLYRKLLVIREVYRQQQEMYDERKRTIPHRIVSISQPHVRPIKRNKAGAVWEFGAKVSIGLSSGLAMIHRIEWDNFNESLDLIGQIKEYHRLFGCWPESVHADRIYRTRENMRFCKDRGIRISGRKLGRPFEDPAVMKALRQQRYEDERIRNAIEGKIGEGKRRYSTDRVMTKLRETSETVISMVYLVMNLERLLREGASSYLMRIYHSLKACLLLDVLWVKLDWSGMHGRG
ncbi:IS5/IS1182 family transposase, partial [Candidatus Fermentibacteria bacterium]